MAVLTFWDPWKAPHGGTLRTRALCRAFATLGHRVTCVFPASDESITGLVDGVERVPIAQQTVGHRQWPTVLQRAKRNLWPLPTSVGARSEQMRAALGALPDIDVLVVSHLSALQYRDAAPGAQLWLDQSDVWSEVARREAAARRGPGRLTARVQAKSLARSEVAAVRAAHVVTAAGWSDHEHLAQLTGQSGARWLPTPVDAPSQPTRPAPQSSGPAAGFLANFAYGPNVDALNLLLRRWADPLAERGWRVLVAGLGSDNLHLPDGVISLGPLDDVTDLYDQVDATLAPVRLGGGMKVKVIESLLYGRSVIATPFALEGFPADVRALATEVDADAPRMPSADELWSQWRPASADVHHRFSIDGFTETVAEALSSPDGGHLDVAGAGG